MAWLVAVVVVVALGQAASGQPDRPLTPADADDFDRSLATILRNVARAARSATGERGDPTVIVSERSVNAYLQFQGAALLPSGITAPSVRMEPAGRVTAAATVSFDELREQDDRGYFDPLRYLSGSLPVTAVATVQSDARAIALDIQSVQIGSVPVPRVILLELVRHYTRSDQYPDGIDLSQSFPLPPGIDAIRVEEGRTVVVQ